MRIILVILLLLLLTPGILLAQNTNKGQLRLLYVPIERIQLGGSVDVYLPTHFHYLKPFDSTTRFAPDEPSSFSSLEYTFWIKEVSDKIALDSGLGIFRNHTKGDFLPEGGEDIHFGLGNSNVGICISLAMLYSWKGWSLGTHLQSGLGPQFSKWTNDQIAFDPDTWGIKGFGWTNNLMVFVETPLFWNRLSLRAFLAYNISYSSYSDFNSISGNGDKTEFSDFTFSTRTRRPVFSISVGYDILKNK